MIPDTYEDWRRCIEIDCGLQLNRSFIEARLKSFANDKDPHTIAFEQKYGKAYTARVMGWFTMALQQTGQPVH